MRYGETSQGVDARTAIFSSIRSALKVPSHDEERRRQVDSRLKAHKANLIPARASGSRQDLMKRFQSTLETQSADVRIVDSVKEVPLCILNVLRDKNLPETLRMGSDPLLIDLDWDEAPQLECLSGATKGDDVVTLSHAFGGAAETGTLFLLSGGENPTTLNFLADTHIVVIEEDSIAGSYEDVWGKIRDVYGAGTMPRVVNLISGPSRTADIEQTIIMGAHGPRQLVVIVVNSKA